MKLRSLKQQKQPYQLQRVLINRVSSKRFRARLIGAYPTLSLPYSTLTTPYLTLLNSNPNANSPKWP